MSLPSALSRSTQPQALGLALLGALGALLAASPPAHAGDPVVYQRRVWLEDRQVAGVSYTLLRVKRHTHVRPLVPAKPETVLQAMTRPHAIAAINGGFFDPQNGQPWGYASIRQGGHSGKLHHLSDPSQSASLRNHPLVGPQLPKWLGERVEWREVNGCGVAWAIQPHRGWSLDPGEVNAALQAGPRLLPKLTLAEEGFRFSEADDLLASRKLLPRSALGLTAYGDMFWAVAKAPGVTLPGLAQAMKALGAQEAMALDGGAEASMAYRLPNTPSAVAFSGAGGALKPVASLLVAYDRSPNE